MRPWFTALGILVYSGGAFGQPADAPRLSLPVRCELGKSCFVQNYVDVDPGPGVRDYACGGATYEGHKGVDFRLHSAAQSGEGVAVIAAAGGMVKGVRDAIDDNLANFGAHKGRECGNGVVIDHGGGWETQYCHMRRGSIVVSRGERIARGQRLGDIGYSGMAEFAHLHVSVRHNGAEIDPFSGRTLDAVCDSSPGADQGLWDEQAAAAMPYEPGRIIAASFTQELPKLAALEQSHVLPEPAKASAQLILAARVMNVRAGDRIRLTIKGPSGFEVRSTSEPLDRNKAMYLAYAGKRRTQASWPAGPYDGEVQLLRGADVVSSMTTRLKLDD